MTGVVVRWGDGGYGFIRPDDGSEEIYVHARQVRHASQVHRWGDRDLAEGDQVTFDVGPPRRGRYREALNVYVLMTPTTQRRFDP